MSSRKTPIYGYMHAYDGTPEKEVAQAELQLFRWAQAEGYDLTAIYREEREGSIAVLEELIRELRLTGDTALVVPSEQHFGTSRILQEHLSDYRVHRASEELHEVGSR